MYTIDEVVSRIAENPTAFSIAAVMVWVIGFAQYFYAIALQIREKRSPWHFYQHAWYFAHDLTFVLLFHQWFYEVDFWTFKVMWAGCIVFVFIELYCLYRSVRYERDELWGTYSDGPVSERSAWTRGIAYYLLAFALFVIARIAIGDPMLLTLTMSTNFMVAVFPLLIVQRRGSRWGGSIVLGWFVIVGTLFTFAPRIGYWTQAAAVFNEPWYFFLGAIAVVGAVWNVVATARLPRKTAQNAPEPALRPMP